MVRSLVIRRLSEPARRSFGQTSPEGSPVPLVPLLPPVLPAEPPFPEPLPPTPELPPLAELPPLPEVPELPPLPPLPSPESPPPQATEPPTRTIASSGVKVERAAKSAEAFDAVILTE